MLKQPSKLRLFLYSLNHPWIDQDYKCRATWSWYIKFKVFGYKFWQQLEGSYLESHGIHKIMGDICGDHNTITCKFCYKNWDIHTNNFSITSEERQKIMKSPVNGYACKYVKLR